MRNRLLGTVLIPLLLVIAERPVGAQTFRGRVVDSESGELLSGVSLNVLRDGRSLFVVRAESSGRFSIVLPGAGQYALAVDRLGFQAYSTEPIAVAVGEVLELELRMSMAAVPLEPLVVAARRSDRTITAEFYRRVERGRRAGHGDFITRVQLDSSGMPLLSSYVARLPRAGLTETGGKVRPVLDGSCLPDIYVNGAPIDVTGSRALPPHAQPSLDELFSLSAVEGLEIYRRREIPPEYVRPDLCGVIIVWLRLPEAGQSRSILRLVAGGGLMATLLLVMLF